jgi:hypothetical protein
VAQERVAKSRAAARALDQAGHVRDGRAAFILDAEVHDAEIRFEGGERVVGDLRGRRRQGRQQRRLAGVRQPDQADVRDEP